MHKIADATKVTCGLSLKLTEEQLARLRKDSFAAGVTMGAYVRAVLDEDSRSRAQERGFIAELKRQRAEVGQ